MKILQARKNNTSKQLTIEPENSVSKRNSVDFPGRMSEQRDLNDESDVISALIIALFLRGKSTKCRINIITIHYTAFFKCAR